LFRERKTDRKKDRRKQDLINDAKFNLQNYKISHQVIFNFAKSFFSIIKRKLKLKQFYNRQSFGFKMQFLYRKNLEKLIRRILLFRIFSKKSHFENKIIHIKKIIDEKSELILKIEHENNELRKHYENSRKETKLTLLENEALKEKIKDLEEKLHYDDVNFKELFNKNINDIKSILTFFYNILFFYSIIIYLKFKINSIFTIN